MTRALPRRRRILQAVLTGAGAAVSGRGFHGAAQQSGVSRLRAGAATANITPSLGCSLAGGMKDRIATEIHDELQVRALVLDDGRTRVAFTVVDSCMAPADVIADAKRMIAEHTGIPPSHVLVAATHTHSAPPATHLFQSEPDPIYVEWLKVRISDCVRMADGRLEPARIGWAVGRLEDEVFHRRWFMKPGTVPPDPFGGTSDTVQMNPGVGNPNLVKPAGPVDPAVPVLSVESTDGRPLAVLGNYALHYVGGTGTGHVSADYFGYWADSMVRRTDGGGRDYPPFVAMLTNGCSANINNINWAAKSRERHPPYVKMKQVAESLAEEADRVREAVRYTDEVTLDASVEELELGVRLPSAEDVRRARRILENAPRDGQSQERPQIYARETLIMADSFPESVRAPVQVLRVGSLGVVAFPVEAFVELGLEVAAGSPFETTIPIELANGCFGYLPTVEGHQQGGYETWRAKSSYLEVGAAPKVVASARRQLELLSRKRTRS